MTPGIASTGAGTRSESRSRGAAGNPGEPDFEREYLRLVALHRSGHDPLEKRDRDEGAYRWLARRYFAEMDTLGDQGMMAQATRKQRTNLLNRTLPKWCQGDILTIRPEHIRAIMADFRRTPGQANNLLKALRAMFALLPSELSTHGVRKAVGALLADAGSTPYEIMAFHGHTDARTSEIYTKTANRRLLAANATDKSALDDLRRGNDQDDRTESPGVRQTLCPARAQSWFFPIISRVLVVQAVLGEPVWARFP